MKQMLLILGLLFSTACATQPIDDGKVHTTINLTWDKADRATHYWIKVQIQSIDQSTGRVSDWTPEEYWMVDTNGVPFGTVEKSTFGTIEQTK